MGIKFVIRFVQRYNRAKKYVIFFIMYVDTFYISQFSFFSHIIQVLLHKNVQLENLTLTKKLLFVGLHQIIFTVHKSRYKPTWLSQQIHKRTTWDLQNEISITFLPNTNYYKNANKKWISQYNTIWKLASNFLYKLDLFDPQKEYYIKDTLISCTNPIVG